MLPILGNVREAMKRCKGVVRTVRPLVKSIKKNRHTWWGGCAIIKDDGIYYRFLVRIQFYIWIATRWLIENKTRLDIYTN